MYCTLKYFNAEKKCFIAYKSSTTLYPLPPAPCLGQGFEAHVYELLEFTEYGYSLHKHTLVLILTMIYL
jgi:hypothetical protein